MTMTRSVILGAVCAVLVLVPAVARSQQSPARAQPGVARQGGGQVPPRRLQLEREVRERIHAIMRREMGLSDAQVERLDEVLLTFEARRRALLRDERQVRISLRDAVQATQRAADTTRRSADEAAIARALDSLLVLQQRRLELVVEEQRQLATFLTPSQRARYFALQENLRRALEERAGGPARPGARRPPAGGGGDPPR